jgi:tetratricopeptide (TPR) repeat protein
LDRFQDADAMLDEMKKTNTSSIDLRLHLYESAFYRDDFNGMSQQVEWARENPEDGNTLLQFAAETSAFNGHLNQAREWTKRAIDSLKRPDRRESLAAFEAAALREALFGDVSLARKYASDATKIDSGREVQYAISLALAFTGTSADTLVEAHLQSLARAFPKDTLVQSHFIPTIVAVRLLRHGKPSMALQVLQTASAYELGVAGVTSFSPNLYPIYVRGEAFLMDQKGKEAETEFRKIINHRGLAFNEPVYIMARIGLGRALALQGDDERARQSYKEFLEFWKGADVSMPLLISVKREAAALISESSIANSPTSGSR